VIRMYNYEYDAQVGDDVLYKDKQAKVIEIDEDIQDVKIQLDDGVKWVKEIELFSKR